MGKWSNPFSRRSANDDLLTRLQTVLEREKNARYKRSVQLLEMNLERAVSAGEIVGPMTLKESEQKGLVFNAPGYFSRFRKGDVVELRTQDGRSTTLAAKGLRIRSVTYPEEGVIEIHTSDTKEKVHADDEYFMYPEHESFFDNKLIALLGGLDKSIWNKKLLQVPDKVSLTGIDRWAEMLNASQAHALHHLVQRNFSGCVQGPPGTGKTHLLRAIVAIALESNLTVGIAAYTHSAVDNALSRLLGLTQNYLRVGLADRIQTKLYKYGALAGHTANSFSDARDIKAQLIAATSHSWALSSHAPEVDLMVIDEAAQLPSYIYPLIHTMAKRVILLGDHKQLAPVLQAKHHDVLPDAFSMELQASGSAPMLEIQYRMNDQIQDWSSRRYYSSKLRSHELNAQRDIIRERDPQAGPASVQLTTHPGRSRDLANPEEARRVAELVGRLSKVPGLALSDIGIITPHRMHAGAVCQQLQRTFGTEKASSLVVDTVERFQGQEREVIILSFGAERDGSIYGKGDSFLGDPRRLNVAVTRAKSRFHCFAPIDLKKNASRNSSGSAANELADFLSWCALKREKKAA